MHKHSCRQLTLSLGSSRVMKVNSQDIMLNHGDLIYLHGQKHGIPKSLEVQVSRLSLNLFFTTSTELQGTS